MRDCKSRTAETKALMVLAPLGWVFPKKTKTGSFFFFMNDFEGSFKNNDFIFCGQYIPYLYAIDNLFYV